MSSSTKNLIEELEKDKPPLTLLETVNALIDKIKELEVAFADLNLEFYKLNKKFDEEVNK